MKSKIKLNAPEEVKDFVKAAGQCDFDIDVFYNRVTIDAKSILGVFSMDLNHPLTVSFQGYNSEFEYTLKKYEIA